MTEQAIEQVWLLSLAVFVVVLLVVAALLTMILSTAKRIHGGVAAIWNGGQRVANNTIHLALLDRTNHLVAAMLEPAGRIAASTNTIATHANGCPGCPACVLARDHGGAR